MEEELAREAVGHALRSGAQYAEARVQRDLGHTYTLKNGTAEPVNVTRKVGIGIRVIVDGALGFASTNSLDREQLRSTTESAVRTAKASKRLVTSPIRLSQEKSWEDNWEAKMKVDVRDVSPEEKYELLFTIEKSLTPENVHVSLPSRILIFDEDLTEKFYVNSEGSKLHGFVPRLSLLFFLTAQEPGKGVAQRLRHEAQSRGWEVVEDWKPKEIAADDAKMLGRLLREGVPPPKGEVDFVLGSEVTGIICHESCGHPQEADRILGREAAQAGESYLKPDIEDLADLGGTLLAYLAWKEDTKDQKLQPLDGLTPEQRFFVAYGQSWCTNEREENKRLRATVDPHSPEKYRANGVVANMAEFRAAFHCKPGQPMVRENACRVW
ncbi:MAG: M13-type metalloendopeptidase [Candidatus Bathyarchaeia archaeon]